MSEKAALGNEIIRKLGKSNAFRSLPLSHFCLAKRDKDFQVKNYLKSPGKTAKDREKERIKYRWAAMVKPVPTAKAW